MENRASPTDPECKPRDLLGMPRAQLEAWFVSHGFQAFRARQVFAWLHAKMATNYQEMTDLAKEVRYQLQQIAPLGSMAITQEWVAQDETRKMRFGLSDGSAIEGVYMPDEKRKTLCISTQVGCNMGCRFCATASMGLVRNLSTAEIVAQVECTWRRMTQLGSQRPITNVVFMGMGEPLANADNVIDAIDILLDDLGLGLSRRHITVSTVGLVPIMPRFVAACPAKLAVSLNASSDEQRTSLMPINRLHPIASLVDVCRHLPQMHNDRITFEYVLIKDVNDTALDAKRLVALLGALRCKVNLIPFNPHPNSPFEAPTTQAVTDFEAYLLKKHISVFVRKSRSEQLQGACGQLVVSNAHLALQ